MCHQKADIDDFIKAISDRQLNLPTSVMKTLKRIKQLYATTKIFKPSLPSLDPLEISHVDLPQPSLHPSGSCPPFHCAPQPHLPPFHGIFPNPTRSLLGELWYRLINCCRSPPDSPPPCRFQQHSLQPSPSQFFEDRQITELPFSPDPTHSRISLRRQTPTQQHQQSVEEAAQRDTELGKIIDEVIHDAQFQDVC